MDILFDFPILQLLFEGSVRSTVKMVDSMHDVTRKEGGVPQVNVTNYDIIIGEENSL